MCCTSLTKVRLKDHDKLVPCVIDELRPSFFSGTYDGGANISSQSLRNRIMLSNSQNLSVSIGLPKILPSLSFQGSAKCEKILSLKAWINAVSFSLFLHTILKIVVFVCPKIFRSLSPAPSENKADRRYQPTSITKISEDITPGIVIIITSGHIFATPAERTFVAVILTFYVVVNSFYSIKFFIFAPRLMIILFYSRFDFLKALTVLNAYKD